VDPQLRLHGGAGKADLAARQPLALPGPEGVPPLLDPVRLSDVHQPGFAEGREGLTRPQGLFEPSCQLVEV
jgi:hypothetical protein